MVLLPRSCPLLFVMGCTVLWIGCKKVSPQAGEQSDQSLQTIRLQKQKSASSRIEVEGISAFFKQVTGKAYITKLDKLKSAAQVTKRPYSGYWYPNTAGGTNVKTDGGEQFTPLEKYDRAFNENKGLATSWEKKYHKASGQEENASWWGHCNGFSASSQRHQEPRSSVIRNGVVFTPLDIKALLAEIYMDSDRIFIAGNRCEDESEVLPTRGANLDLNACQDTNPGAFHLALANWIGEADQPFLFDRQFNNEVWNFPLYQYQSQIDEISRQKALEALGILPSEPYNFNPAATQFRRVTTTITYSNVANLEILQAKVDDSLTYHYLLELDDQGNIVGGEWINSRNSKGYPDFIWLALDPMPPQGLREYGNPHLDIASVLGLWAESVGITLADFHPISRPPVPASSWGQNTLFKVRVDSGLAGAVFLGKDIFLHMDRLNEALTDAQFNLQVNQGNVKTFAAEGKEPVHLKIDDPFTAGINRLQIIWHKGGQPINEAHLDLTAYGVP